MDFWYFSVSICQFVAEGVTFHEAVYFSCPPPFFFLSPCPIVPSVPRAVTHLSLLGFTSPIFFLFSFQSSNSESHQNWWRIKLWPARSLSTHIQALL